MLRRDRSRIRAWAIEPDVAQSLAWLREDCPDDRILASALEVVRAHALGPTAVVTRDIGLGNKCELANMPVLLPPSA